MANRTMIRIETLPEDYFCSLLDFCSINHEIFVSGERLISPTGLDK